jgi:hypothetical protein
MVVKMTDRLEELRLLRIRLADLREQIAHHNDVLSELWLQMLELRAKIRAASEIDDDEDDDQ